MGTGIPLGLRSQRVSRAARLAAIDWNTLGSGDPLPATKGPPRILASSPLSQGGT